MEPSNVPTVYCTDSTLEFDTKNNGIKYGNVDCKVWVNEDADERCEFKNVKTMCPETCNSCDPCSDTGASFYIGTKEKTCANISKKQCSKKGVFHACRATCGTCPSLVPSNVPSSAPSKSLSSYPSVFPS